MCVAVLCACGDGKSNPASATDVGPRTAAGYRNTGTQVWLVPVPAGDMMRLAEQPESWPTAQQRIDVVSVHVLQAYHHPGFECGVPCGPNTYPNLMQVVPGGMFKWLSERFILGIDSESVKSHACTEELVRGLANMTLNAIVNAERHGGRVSYLSMDEPFASGVFPVDTPGFGGCGLSVHEVARLQRVYNDTIHAAFPRVAIGFIEPYPKFSVEEIMSQLLELEHAGVPIPYFHLDLHLQGAIRERSDVAHDLRRLHEFCRARGIPFATIIFGEDGTSNEGYAADAWATARLIATTTGVTEHTVFQSWAESEPGNLVSRKDKPDTVPETDPFTHTGLVLRILEFFQIQPAR